MEIKDIEFKGVTLTVHYNYTPEEEQVSYYGDLSGYPGSGAEVEILNIFIGNCDEDMVELLEDYLDEIAEKVLEEIS